MSSPIHKYLFSPPASPPSRASSGKNQPPALDLLESTISPLLEQLSPRLGSSSDGVQSTSTSTQTLHVGMNPRSPRTPQNRFGFTLNDTYPSPYGSQTPRGRKLDVETGVYTPMTTPRVIVTQPTTPRERIVSRTLIQSTPLIPSNVPTSTTIHASLPKPLLRLLFLLTLVVASLVVLVWVPGTRIPSLRDASVGRRLAMDNDGRAWLDVVNPINSWSEGKERDYQPAKIKSSKMMKRGMDFLNGVEGEVLEVKLEQLPLLPQSAQRAATPKPTPRPIPSTHELIALQSYLRGSAYNTLPQSVDPKLPLDANTILGFKGDLKDLLNEIELENQDEVVVWYGGNGVSQIPHELLSYLSEIHGDRHKPTLLPCHSRSDLPILTSLFGKYDLPLKSHPIIMVGNQPIIGDFEALKADSSELKSMLSKIGWAKGDVKGPGKAWKPKYAVLQRREVGEIEQALKAVKR